MIRLLRLGVVLLAVSPASSKADELPVSFARAGRETTLSLAADPGGSGGPVMLSAYHRFRGKPVPVEHGRARVIVPAVRTPTVFQVVPVRDDKLVLAELVAYPEGWLPWKTDKKLSRYKETQFVAAGVPQWLDAWLDAVEFPFQRLAGRESLERDHWRTLEKAAVLVLGRSVAGRGPAEVGRLAADHRANVLVIEADWLGQSKPGADGILVTPEGARGALADLESQQWASPPRFGRQAVPWPKIWNRLTWLDGADYPFVEELYSRQKGAESLRIAFSYLPWQSQLGRCEVADELFLRILSEAAQGAGGRPELNRRWCLLYPTVEKIKPDVRPVLSAALPALAAKAASDRRAVTGAEYPEADGYVLDLRGAAPLPDELFADSGAVKGIAARINERTPLLILGDDRQLDHWEWLELDRKHQKSARPGVAWLPDCSLPPSLESRLRVMEVLTRWGVFLENTSREKSDEDRENEL